MLKLKIVSDDTTHITEKKDNLLIIRKKIGNKIPFIHTLIESNDCNEIIDFDSMYYENILNFIKLISDYLSVDYYHIADLKKSLEHEFKESEIITHLQYLGMDNIFNKIYPLASDIKLVDNIDSLILAVINCDKIRSDRNNVFVFSEHIWISKSNNEIMDFIKNDIILRHQPFMKDQIKLIFNDTKMIEIIAQSIHFSLKSNPLHKVGILNSKKNLIGFNNGVYNLIKGKLRHGKPSDLVSYSVGYDYNSNYTNKNNLLHFLKTIMPDDSARNSLLKAVANSLIKKHDFNFIGYGVVKDIWIKLIMSAFGSMYCGYQFDTDFLHKKFIICCNHYSDFGGQTHSELLTDANRIFCYDDDDDDEQEDYFNQSEILNTFKFPYKTIDPMKVNEYAKLYHRDFLLLLLEILKDEITVR